MYRVQLKQSLTRIIFQLFTIIIFNVLIREKFKIISIDIIILQNFDSINDLF